MPTTGAGHFYDGRTAARRAVTVVLTPSVLEIADPDGSVLERWPYAELRAVGAGRGGVPLRIARGETDEARLALADASVRAALLARAPQLLRRSPRPGCALGRFGLVLGGVALAVLALWFLWPPAADLIARAVPASWEARLGRQVAASLFAGEPVCDDPAGAAALDRLTARLAAAAEAPLAVEVRVVDSPAVNAFALPGGQVVLFRGLLEAAGSADEIAGVLAHEIGHVAARHGIRVLVRHLGLSLLAQAMSGGADLAQVAPFLMTRAYSRDFEAEADARAVALLSRAGVHADGLSRFFARLERKERDLPAFLAYLSTHPSTAARSRATAAAASGGGPAMSAADWTALRRICR